MPKDSWLLKYGLETYGRQVDRETRGRGETGGLRLIPLAREINDGMPGHMAALIEEALAEAGRELVGAKVVLLGVAYLENADDARNTPAAALARLLLACRAEVVAHDPYVREADWRRALGDGVDVPLAENLWEALRGADCVALVTRHREYQALDLQGMKDAMRTPVLVDGRDVFDPVRCAKVGFVMRTVGRG